MTPELVAPELRAASTGEAIAFWVFAPLATIAAVAMVLARNTVHAALFLALAVTGRWAGVGQAVLAVLLVLYAAGSEVVQGLDAVGRSASVADWLADVVGALAGLVLWAVVARRRPPARA